ncbi:hypothetical protein ciss_13600 [Carboxydothermus islandicus]|uniref:Uncharacterized protein n=1 Tax=Carboxydothermus islandicus TaxID=661089 RepID=A0A1L8D2U2_9THEO|nr:hypothetical protein ciss_13600 [Carboxydothermus islandicus]
MKKIFLIDKNFLKIILMKNKKCEYSNKREYIPDNVIEGSGSTGVRWGFGHLASGLKGP